MTIVEKGGTKVQLLFYISNEKHKLLSRYDLQNVALSDLKDWIGSLVVTLAFEILNYCISNIVCLIFSPQ